MPAQRSLFAWLWLLIYVLSQVEAVALRRRDADFESVRTRLRMDHSGKRGDPVDKYFHESVFHPHYDGRFAEDQLSYTQKKDRLSLLMETYLMTMRDIGVETWIMHGSLLGWWWNQKIMPWDSDVDVQVSERTIHFLAEYYNMTTYRYTSARAPEGSNYMIEVNPKYINRGRDDTLNVIDARYIDTDTGLFIDITTARKNESHAVPGLMSCKDGHDFLEKDLFPLRSSKFEGMDVKIPYNYVGILTAEYGKEALTRTIVEHHEWHPEHQEWEPLN